MSDKNIKLLFSAMIGNIDEVKLLLKQGATLEIQDQGKKTGFLLSEVVQMRNNIVKLLQDNGIDPYKAEFTMSQEWLIGSVAKQSEMFEIIVVNGAADVNTQDKDGNTDLILASKDGRIERVKLLLEHGADVSKKNNADETALMWATKNNHDNIATLLNIYIENHALTTKIKTNQDSSTGFKF